MLDMKHIPCFRAAAAWGNFSSLHRNLTLLLLQFPGASTEVLPHSTIARKRFETVRTFHQWRVFFFNAQRRIANDVLKYNPWKTLCHILDSSKLFLHTVVVIRWFV